MREGEVLSLTKILTLPAEPTVIADARVRRMPVGSRETPELFNAASLSFASGSVFCRSIA
jgi:hypothetical protein